MREFLAACIITPIILVFLATAFHPLIPDAPESLQQLREERQLKKAAELKAASLLVDSEVRDCVKSQGPWDCFERLRELDIIKALPTGSSRTGRFAAIVPAERAFLFCSYERKAQCANTMVRYGYSLADVEPLLQRYYDRDPEKITSN